MAVVNSGMTLYTDNDTQQDWSGTDDLDDYNNSIQGSNSESWQVSKNSTETGTLTKSANMGTSKYFTFYMASNLAPYYTSVTLEVRTNSSNYESFTIATSSLRLVSGDFHPIVVEFGEGTETGTLDLTSIADIRITVNNSSSGNIRSVINNWIDTMWYGSGRTIGGSTTSDKLFFESHTLDTTTNDNYDGCSELYKGSLAYQTNITVNTTTGNSYGETVVFAHGNNTSDSYTLSITGTAYFKASNVIVSDSNVTLNFTSSDATSFSMEGGSLIASGTTVFKSGQNIKGAVIGNRTSITHGACNFENNTINSSGVMTVSSTGTCTNNTFNKPSGVSAIKLANLSYAPNNTFVSDGSSHAVELSSIGSGTMTWSGNTSGFESGSTGSPVTPTSTGNEDIYVNVSSGTLTINVSDSATTPSIRSAGATVNVVAGQKEFKFTILPSLTSYEWRIYSVTAIGSMDGATELDGQEDATIDNQTYSYSYASDTPVAVQIINQPDNDYEESITYYTLGNADQTVTINLKKDNNN